LTTFTELKATYTANLRPIIAPDSPLDLYQHLLKKCLYPILPAVREEAHAAYFGASKVNEQLLISMLRQLESPSTPHLWRSATPITLLQHLASLTSSGTAPSFNIMTQQT